MILPLLSPLLYVLFPILLAAPLVAFFVFLILNRVHPLTDQLRIVTLDTP